MSLILTAAIWAVLPVASERLDPVTVTATRRPQPRTSVLADVTVIERTEIEASQAPDLLELLRWQPGVDLARTGGSGQSTSLFLRGSNSNHVLFLVDGVRVASSNTGAAAFEHLALDQIERIEIVRGPRASYYGSDAIGGVIAITTRERQGPGLLIRSGSQGRAAAAAAYGFDGERGAFSVQLGGEHYDGFSAQTPDGFGYDPDDDGYCNSNLALRGRLALGDQQLGFSALATRADVEFDQGESDVDQHALALTLDGPLAAHWSHRMTLGNARDDLQTPVYFSRFATRRSQLDWIHQLGLAGDQHLVFGLNLQRERGLSATIGAAAPDYAETLQHQALFVGWQGSSGLWDHELVLRHDEHERFGGKLTAQAALGWRFNSGRVYANWGQGFRAPNLNELYSPGFGGAFIGNAALDPERSRSLEFGVEASAGGVEWGANAYRTRIDGLIAFEGGQNFQAINISRAAIDGLELMASRQWQRWSLNGQWTWQDAENAGTGADLLRRPARKAALDFGYRFDGGLRLSADLGYASERRDFGGSLHAYTLLGLRADWPLSAQWSLGARLANLSDREYQWAAGFAAPGREFIVNLRWEAQP